MTFRSIFLLCCFLLGHYILESTALDTKSCAIADNEWDGYAEALGGDMNVLCDAFRLSNNTRFALAAYDATTIEDFAFMTDSDFQGMVLSTSHIGRPIPPLQQRKVMVLLDWARALIDENVANASGGKESPANTDAELIPFDWEQRFRKDLPKLKRKLKELGAAKSWRTSFVEILSLKWFF